MCQEGMTGRKIRGSGIAKKKMRAQSETDEDKGDIEKCQVAQGFL